MYEIIKNVIQTGSFELPSILKKIDTFWVKGQLTDEQRDELIDLARLKANPETGIDIYKAIAQIEEKQRDIEMRLQALESAGEEPSEPEEPSVDDVAEWKEGVRYYNGDLVKFEGKLYLVANVPEGQCCVWSPASYPNYYQLVE